MSYQIGEVATLAKVSIRTLHHYDAIGLLVPSLRSDAGYRYYSDSDLQKLQLIRFYRTLEFSLADIKDILTSPDFSREGALLHQRELLRARASELAAVLALIDNTLDSLISKEDGAQETTMSNKLSNTAMFEVFPEMDEAIQEEAEQRWGNSEAWKQSAKRTSKYTKADWQRLKEEMASAYGEAERVFSAGHAADSVEGMACAEAARLLIDRWFYDCSREFHATLTAGTSGDPRFVANIDRNCSGLAVWLHQASLANYQRHE
ncbi:MAG: MerR family transcriptional regulator [Pseudomonadota bacterium]